MHHDYITGLEGVEYVDRLIWGPDIRLGMTIPWLRLGRSEDVEAADTLSREAKIKSASAGKDTWAVFVAFERETPSHPRNLAPLERLVSTPSGTNFQRPLGHLV